MTLEKAWKKAKEKRSRIFLALDIIRGDPKKLIHKVVDLIVGIKIGLPFLLNYNIEIVKDIINSFGNDLYFLADFKLADIPDIIMLETNILYKIGFDGVIVHLFQGGIPSIRKKIELDLIGVVYMSHKETHIFRKVFEDLLKEAEKSDLDGVIVGARKKEIIDILNKELIDVDILSPGIGVQGGKYGEALKNGADFEIIGRAITNSNDPRSKVLEILEGERKWI